MYKQYEKETYNNITKHSYDFFNFYKAIDISAGFWINNFHLVKEALERHKIERNNQALFEWTGAYKGDGYDENMKREMRELTYIQSD